MKTAPKSTAASRKPQTTIRRLRKLLGLNQSELAKAAAITNGSLSNIENHGLRANPTVNTLAGIARALGMATGDLLRMMEGDGEQEGQQSPAN